MRRLGVEDYTKIRSARVLNVLNQCFVKFDSTNTIYRVNFEGKQRFE